MDSQLKIDRGYIEEEIQRQYYDDKKEYNRLMKLLKEMNFNQRTNHYPGIYNLARKNYLGRHLMKMKKLLPNDYDFFPKTYMLPFDYSDFREDA